ncbi:c-type cytochrome [bacterium M00.F.Ca.ET.228.01.1.1]|uniref:cytochrome-c peroxidase n=1 Tax=Paraburkholderia phenoliruptrix TaxID=252970 RepID=UPI001091D3FE|nr:cytochrome c peroxidase [Paraburkholderia phenoliruptrix]TGP41348.1 c-type cytochrome [bacterium M00.F.Ca.ET.228.01.1.1]TGR98005.1 c-type cytochrome [bacterium M00.F.Ca.ET.191.01.1.1]TGU02195.1 c-type cytochrome [bacterium M00.F.Ca.ET.155.01.1.1]MBW0446983.1 c-type cytochrome [Paraburkholderia phenoliruptrix]MBW9101161.1 c-type cytochrome [Paraburkholderia phenoliruptrix]
MNQTPDAALPPTLPAGGEPGPVRVQRSLRGVVAWAAACVVSAAVAFGAYALIYPERMPVALGALVEEITGANPQPVHLLRPARAPLSAVALLGKEIFFDQSLSASGTQSCASCHSPNNSYSPDNAFPVQLGGAHMNEAGYRPPPSLTYLYRQAPFSIGPDQGDTDAPVDLTQLASQAAGTQRAQKTALAAPAAPALVPQGGLFWDGRADTLQDQAIGPLTNPVEMANKTPEDVAQKLLHTRYIGQFKQIFGPAIEANPSLLVSEAMFAVGRYQIEDPSFHAFSSKYDYWLEGKARLTRAELHGLQLFNDKDKANCAGCHLSQPGKDGLPPVFTDTQYEALGVPRNPAIPANRDPGFFDMGVCGPFRHDLAKETQYCGMFLTPTLRNVANRKVFFHNGVYHDLKQVMDFYNLRNTSPEKIYPRDASGKVQKYNDLPAQYHANVDASDAPFDRKLGDKPAMSDADIEDIIAFMKTLSDGYHVGGS